MISDAEIMANALREISNITKLGQVKLKDCQLLLRTIGSIARAALPADRNTGPLGRRCRGLCNAHKNQCLFSRPHEGACVCGGCA